MAHGGMMAEADIVWVSFRQRMAALFTAAGCFDFIDAFVDNRFFGWCFFRWHLPPPLIDISNMPWLVVNV